MIHWRRTVCWIAACVATVLVAAASFCVLETYYERWRAQQFFEIYAALRPGITEEDAQKALHRFRLGEDRMQTGERFRARVNSEKDGQLDAFGRAYIFSNRKMRLLHLGVPTEADGILYFRDGALVLKHASLKQGSGSCCLVLVKEANRQFEDIPEQYPSREGLRHYNRMFPDFVSLQLYPDAPESSRRKAYEFNLSQLTSFSACKTAGELLPVAGSK